MFDAELSDVALYGSIPRFGDMTVHGVIDLRRAYSREDLEGAARAAVAAFPVLGRCYRTGFVRDRWVPVAGPLSDVVQVVDEPADLEAETAAWVERPLVLDRDRPFRLVSLRRGDRSRLILTISHVAADGGGMAAVGHVIGAHLAGVAPALPVERRRDLGTSLARLRWWHAPVLARDLVGAVLRPVRTLRAGRRERPFPVGRDGAPSFRHVTISAADLATLKARCRPLGASVNDLVIAGLARVAAGRARGEAVSMLYTMDLRRYAAEPRLSAANTSSILSVVVPRARLRDFSSAAQAVAEITTRHRRGLAGPAFVLLPVALSGAVPHGLVRFFLPLLHPVVVDLPLDRGLMVTNVGAVDQGLGAFADEIEDLRIVGPNITQLDVPLVVAYGFRGELRLHLFAAPTLAPEGLEAMERELRAALELPPGPLA